MMSEKVKIKSIFRIRLIEYSATEREYYPQVLDDNGRWWCIDVTMRHPLGIRFTLVDEDAKNAHYDSSRRAAQVTINLMRKEIGVRTKNYPKISYIPVPVK